MGVSAENGPLAENGGHLRKVEWGNDSNLEHRNARQQGELFHSAMNKQAPRCIKNKGKLHRVYTHMGHGQEKGQTTNGQLGGAPILVCRI